METMTVSFFYVSLCFVVFSLRDGIARNNVALRFTTLTPPCGDESRPQPSNVSCERHERSLRVLLPGKSRDFDTKSRLFPMKFMPNGKSEIIGLWNILRMCNILRIWRHKFYFIFAKQKFHNYLIISYCFQYFIECVKLNMRCTKWKDCNFDTKLQSFLTKSAFVGINPLRGWNLLFVGLTRRMTQSTASGMHMWWNPANAGLIEADLISSEMAHRRFHPSSLGFHPAKQDFIKFIRLAGIFFVLASLFCF